MSSYKCNETTFSSLSEDNFGPLNRMPKVWKEGIVNMDGILELPKRNRSLFI